MVDVVCQLETLRHHAPGAVYPEGDGPDPVILDRFIQAGADVLVEAGHGVQPAPGAGEQDAGDGDDPYTAGDLKGNAAIPPSAIGLIKGAGRQWGMRPVGGEGRADLGRVAAIQCKRTVEHGGETEVSFTHCCLLHSRCPPARKECPP